MNEPKLGTVTPATPLGPPARTVRKQNDPPEHVGKASYTVNVNAPADAPIRPSGVLRTMFHVNRSCFPAIDDNSGKIGVKSKTPEAESCGPIDIATGGTSSYAACSER